MATREGSGAEERNESRAEMASEGDLVKKVARKSMKLGGGGRFAALESRLAGKGVHDPAALAASIGRKKYGAKKFGSLSKGK